MQTAAIQEPYRVKLETFEGPLDLLLHLIKKNEMDISGIAISAITQQYLDTIEMMKSLNLEVVGEYLVMAATLAHWKSKSLLPEDSLPDQAVDLEEEGDEQQLAKRLLEYQKFKEAGEYFERQPWLGRDVFERQADHGPTVVRELNPVSLYTLVELFYERLKKLPKIFAHEVTLERVTVAERIQEILTGLERNTKRSVSFNELLDGVHTRYDVIVTFLALLEMVRVHLVALVQVDEFAPIVIHRGSAVTAVLDEQEINYGE